MTSKKQTKQRKIKNASYSSILSFGFLLLATAVVFFLAFIILGMPTLARTVASSIGIVAALSFIVSRGVAWWSVRKKKQAPLYRQAFDVGLLLSALALLLVCSLGLQGTVSTWTIAVVPILAITTTTLLGSAVLFIIFRRTNLKRTDSSLSRTALAAGLIWLASAPLMYYGSILLVRLFCWWDPVRSCFEWGLAGTVLGVYVSIFTGIVATMVLLVSAFFVFIEKVDVNTKR